MSPAAVETEHRLAFLYPSRGLWAGMAPHVYAMEGAFRTSLDISEGEIRRRLGWSLEHEFARLDPDLPECERFVDPAFVALGIAMTDAWRERGVRPDLIAGVSGGEIPAGYGRGALSQQGTMELACRLSRMFREDPGPGRVVVVNLPIEQIDALRVSAPVWFHVAGEIGPEVSIVACTAPELDRLVAFLRSHGGKCRFPPVTVATHSPLMDRWEPDITAPLASSNPASARLVPAYSTVVSGKLDDSFSDPAFWWRAISERIHFRRMISNMIADGCTVILEIGARPTYASVIKDVAASLGKPITVLPTMRWTEPLQPVMEQTLERLAQLGLVGERESRLSARAPRAAAYA